MEVKRQKTIVIGAGIVGVSTALWLLRDGHEVVLVDRVGPAAGASYGNAGVLAAGSVVPVTVPGLQRKAPRMLFSANQPLFLRWAYLPRLVPFLTRYLRHATDASVRKTSSALHLLLHDCVEYHLALAHGTGAANYVRPGDYVFGYANRAAYEADAYGWSVRKAQGIEFEELERAELERYDPALRDRFGFAVRCPGHGQITDPGAYLTALADEVEALADAA